MLIFCLQIVEESIINDGKPVTSAVVETLGIGQQVGSGDVDSLMEVPISYPDNESAATGKTVVCPLQRASEQVRERQTSQRLECAAAIQ